MPTEFRPATTGHAPCIVALAGGTNTGKSWSTLRLARGYVGPKGKIAAIDTEGGRLSSLARHHRFDISYMQPPFTPTRFAEMAEDAEAAGYDAVVIDSFSLMHVGPGGYRDWHRAEVDRMIKGDENKREAMSWQARRAPSLNRQAMFYSMLQRRIPLFLALRAREMTEKQGNKVVPIGWQPVIHDEFMYDVTVSFTLRPEYGKGIIRHEAPFKLERDHEAIFRDGDLLTEDHGAALAEIMRREEVAPAFEVIRSDGKRVGFPSIEGWASWWDRPIIAASKDALQALREGNAGLMAAYADEHRERVMDVQRRIGLALGGNQHEPDDDTPDFPTDLPMDGRPAERPAEQTGA